MSMNEENNGMSKLTAFSYEPWPAFSYADFQSTGYLLHRAAQMLGKLKLNTPFEPHWANVVLPITSFGLTTGPIPYAGGVFSLDMDLIAHRVMGSTSWGMFDQFEMTAMSVAQFKEKLFTLLRNLHIDLSINLMPQEVSNPVPFDQDMEQRAYDKKQANAWWRILVSSYLVLQRYHARFNGETPPIGLMWGTFDLRDARYSGVQVPTTGDNAGYIRRNAMDEEQIEAGWWAGNEVYPRAAYFSFAYPAPKTISETKIQPEAAHWNEKMGTFVLDYDDLLKSTEPDKTLLAFFESTYQSGAQLLGWNPHLIMPGYPI